MTSTAGRTCSGDVRHRRGRPVRIRRLARLEPFGLDAGINYVERDLVAEVMRLTSGRGVDLVLDPVGGHVLEQSIAAAAHRGRIVNVGTASREFGKIDVSGLLSVPIDRTFPLAEAAAAHAFIESRRAVGRVLLIP